MGIRRRAKDAIEEGHAAAAEARELIADAKQAIPEVKDPFVELIEQLRSEGVELSVEIAGKEMPVKLRMKPKEPKVNP